MRKIKIPAPQIDSHLEGFFAVAKDVEFFEVALKKFFGQKVSIYFQGEFTATQIIKIQAATKILNNSKWTLASLNPDLKNVVIIMNNKNFKMQCNFYRTLPDSPFLKLTEFEALNSQIIFNIEKKNRSIDFYFKERIVTKEVVHEC